MKRNKNIASCVIVLIFISTTAFAESVFLKDGTIYEGKIVKEDDNSVVLLSSDKTEIKIQRSNIIRVIFHKNYRNKQYLHKMNGDVIEMYLVDEDSNNYTYRTDLTSPDEVSISKNDVDGITKTKMGVIPKNNSVSEKNNNNIKNKRSIIIKRNSEYTNWSVVFKIILDGKVIGEVGNGKEATFPVSEGTHQLFVQIMSWGYGENYKSNIINFNIKDNSVEFECGNRMGCLKGSCLFYYLYSNFFINDNLLILNKS